MNRHQTATATRILLFFLTLGSLLVPRQCVWCQEPAGVLEGKIASQPILVGYARNVSPKKMMEYMTRLSEKIQVGAEMRKELDQEAQQERLDRIQPKVEEPLYGFATYMVTGLIPSFEVVSFQQVLDEADARRLIDGQKDQWGPTTTLEEFGNGCFRVLMKNESSFPLPEGADETQYSQNNTGNRTYQFTQRVVEKDGKKMVEHSQVFTQLVRYHDNVLYQASFPELFQMELPSRDAIASAINGQTDLGFQAYLDRIPTGLRQLGFTMLSSAAGSQLQQRDGESDTSYQMRRTAGDTGLSLVQSILFDIDNSSGWATFANADADSLQGELRVRARNNSQLGQRLLESSGISRFAPILAENAAATLHVCFRIPEEAPVSLEATAAWLQEELSREFAGDAPMLTAAETVNGILRGIAEHRTIECFARAGWTDASNGVFYGGIQVSDEPDLLRSLHYLITHAPGSPADIEQKVAMEDRNGLPVIVIRLSDPDIEQARAALGINLTQIFVAHQNSCLWIAAGTENAVEIIRESVSRCTENPQAVRTPLISARIDMERWLNYPQDDPAKIAQMPYWLDENAWWFPPSPMSALAFSSVQSASKPRAVMQSVFDLGGSKQAALTLEADDSGLLLKASLGEALANHMLARMIDLQDSMIQGQRRAAEEQQKQLKERLKQQTEAAGQASPAAN